MNDSLVATCFSFAGGGKSYRLTSHPFGNHLNASFSHPLNVVESLLGTHPKRKAKWKTRFDSDLKMNIQSLQFHIIHESLPHTRRHICSAYACHGRQLFRATKKEEEMKTRSEE